jgi:N-glycosylase/DNA lyase
LSIPLPARGSLSPNGPFDLALTLLCGQCFRWNRSVLPDTFEGIAGGAFWRLRQEGSEVHWACSSSRVRDTEAGEWIAGYLNLGQDLSGFEGAFRDHPVLAEPIRLLRGLRLIRQEPWECSASYLFAQSLSVKVIQRALEKFCNRFGEEIEGIPGQHAFPPLDRVRLLSPKDLRPFANNNRARAERIVKLARSLEAGVISLPYLKSLTCDEARRALTSLEGIGPKIADCILLFSLDHGSAFPVDRWVLKALKSYFPSVRFLGASGSNPTPSQYPALVQKARAVFGPWCGLASEYLFLYLRLLEDPGLQVEMGLRPDAAYPVPKRKKGAQRVLSKMPKNL